MESEQLQRAIEAILFAAGERIDIVRLAAALETDASDVEKAADELADKYAFERRGIRILKLEKGYQMVSSGEMADYVTKALETRKPPKLSSSQLETLTIIAYYQPATKAMVEQIRGVDSSYTVSLLLERDLIEECGRLAVPGRPIQYRTTQTFLRSFGLSNLDELPELPNTTPEDGQLTLEMQAAVERLQAAQTAEGTEEVTEEELLQAAREMAQAEEEA